MLPRLSAPLFVLYRRLPRDAAKHCVVEARREPAQAGRGSLLCALRPQGDCLRCGAARSIFFSELQKCGTPQQAAFALLRLHGYSIAEIAARYKLDPRRVRRMLKSLYSAYLRFRGDGKEATK